MEIQCISITVKNRIDSRPSTQPPPPPPPSTPPPPTPHQIVFARSSDLHQISELEVVLVAVVVRTHQLLRCLGAAKEKTQEKPEPIPTSPYHASKNSETDHPHTIQAITVNKSSDNPTTPPSSHTHTLSRHLSPTE